MKKLNEEDIKILNMLVPDIENPDEHSSLLPPISRYYVTDKEDFKARLEKLPEEDLKYLAQRAMDGSECLLCISPRCAETFLDMVDKKLSRETAGRLREIFENVTGYKMDDQK